VVEGGGLGAALTSACCLQTLGWISCVHACWCRIVRCISCAAGTWHLKLAHQGLQSAGWLALYRFFMLLVRDLFKPEYAMFTHE